jgi:uncharacterized protein (DUF4415 family)
MRRALTTIMTFHCEEPSLMKSPTTLKPRKSVGGKSNDPDNPPWAQEMLGPPRIRQGRGPQKAPRKVSTTIRLDKDVYEYFHSQGAGYQTQINAELRKIVERNLATHSTRTRAKARAG